ncbi:MAG: YeeE/YedE family protein [Polaromonas sp.]|uniref:YeeE/YedE family protein n=1 Tax=Polaromonas sp. TaxID=1869339 RepID=UPI0027316D9A|nr:YeeE/YedE family protein [Polaromonas sp.]MDP2450735.1 YeeE/YedE family protein [Polaromonas sp.]MDP3249095.1 YeeE/YedE family protein [Polaromonas sp.]MDP3756447.1 YeeE/YedE family protein [Polaromonas sp.]
MSEAISPATMVVWGGFVLAFIFGAVANKTNFCTMGAISDIVNMAHWGRMRMWLLTIAVAVVGSNLLYYFGLIDLSKSVYQRPSLTWLSMLLGGFLFGVGMTIAAGCTNKNLVRLGGGSVRSLVVLVFLAISAYMTLKGLFGQWRASYLDTVVLDLSQWGLTTQGLSQILARLTGLPEKTALLTSALVVGLGLLVFVFKDKRFRGNLSQVTGAIVLGLLIVAAWFLTGNIGYGENPDTLETVYFATNTRTLESLSFVAPTAFSLELLMLWTDKSMRVTFGIATVIGVVLGSFAYAVSTRQFRWEGFASLEDLRTQLTGAVLMGFGGVTALGCTIGQGLSGVSTLALGSFIALTGIISGAVVTMKWQQR